MVVNFETIFITFNLTPIQIYNFLFNKIGVYIDFEQMNGFKVKR